MYMIEPNLHLQVFQQKYCFALMSLILLRVLPSKIETFQRFDLLIGEEFNLIASFLSTNNLMV